MFNYYIDLSERILKRAKSEEDTTSLRKELYYVRVSSLEGKINTDELKKIFWINIYNAYVLIMSQEQIQHKKFFKLKRIKFSCYILSLNDIEYGILKLHKYKIGSWKIHNSFYPHFIKKLAVKKSDSTISGLLNKNILSYLIDFNKVNFDNFN